MTEQPNREGEDGPSILLVDDDRTLRNRLARAFLDRGFVAHQAEDGRAGIELAKVEAPEYVLLDLRMPGMHGLEVIPEIFRVDPNTNLVVLTGYGSIATALEAVRLGATHYLTKPVEMKDILEAFARRPGDSFVTDSSIAQETPTLARVEWEHIERVLTDCGGNISEAARRLGVHRRSLQRKLSKHPVPR